MSRLGPELGEPAICVPLDTIIDSGRVLRRPLGEWANDLAKLIRKSANPPDLETVGRGCSALNNAALVFAHAGQPDFAGEICRLQLSWLESFHGVMGDGEVAVLSIQPWVNLGRLCRRAGDYDGAAAYFRTLRCKGEGEEFRQSAEPIYVYETLRNYLQGGDLDGAVEFADGLETPLLTSTLMLKTELLIHISLRRGEIERLLTLIREMHWPRDQFGILAQYFYTALALGAGGQPAASSSTLSRIAQQWRKYSCRQELDSRDLRFGIELYRLAKDLKQSELLKNLFTATSAMILAARDVPFALQLLGIAKGDVGYEDGPTLDNLCELVEGSGYKGTRSQTNDVPVALAGLRKAITILMDVSQRDVTSAKRSASQLASVHA